MRIVQLTPGAGDFYCGSCIRDNALVVALRELGHEAILVPLYLPSMVDDTDAGAGEPILLGGVNMYLQERSALFRRTPRFLDRLFDSPALLGLAAKRAGMTRPEDLGEITLSTLRGEAGHQAKEVRRLAEWVADSGSPDVVCLGNVLLVGLVRELRDRLGPVAVVSTLQGEDGFLDSLPEPHRSRAWDIVAERARELDALIPVSRTYGEVMTDRLSLDPARVFPVLNGIRVEGFEPAPAPPVPSAIGYLARMNELKGLGTLVEAFLRLGRDERLPGLRLRIAGTCTGSDEAFIKAQVGRIRAAGLEGRVDWHRDVSREEKIEFLQGLSVLSVPATCGESFGLYVIEALAAGVPVVQPRHGAFPELIGATGGGLLCEPDDPDDLANRLTELLLDPRRARELGARGRKAVLRDFTVERMARDVLGVFQEALARRGR